MDSGRVIKKACHAARLILMRLKTFHDAHQEGARHGVAHPAANSRASQGVSGE